MPLPRLQGPNSNLLKLLGLVKGLISATFLFISLIIINFLQCLSLLTLPFSRILFRSINRFFANVWWSACDLWAEHWWKINVQFLGDKVPEKENALLVSNHQDMADITSLFRIARSKKRLGDIKWFVKDFLKFVPGIGWGMIFLDCIFLKRNWDRDKKHVNDMFSKFEKYDIPIWAISFVEGTRLRPNKLTKSQTYAKRNGLIPLKHLLTPRTKGFTATVIGLRNHLDAVYDVTIIYNDGVPTLWQWAQGYVKSVNIHIKRFSIEDLPVSQEDLSSWLLKRFKIKDELLDHYYLKKDEILIS